MKFKKLYIFLLACLLVLTGCSGELKNLGSNHFSETINLSDIPEYSGEPYVVLNNNVPDFDETDKTLVFERYSNLDDLGRCGFAYANLCPELMPEGERESIGSVKPSGWVNKRYDDLISDKYVYNRCHLIGYQLAGENANEKNLITGTRYLNIEGMLPFENQVADYIKDTGHHVLYRVTPIFEGNNLVASGVQMEALSVESDEIQFNVYCYNIQPGIEIDYATGENWRNDESIIESNQEEARFIGNKNTKVYHSKNCGSLPKAENRVYFKSSQAAEDKGYASHNCIK